MFSPRLSCSFHYRESGKNTVENKIQKNGDGLEFIQSLLWTRMLAFEWRTLQKSIPHSRLHFFLPCCPRCSLFLLILTLPLIYNQIKCETFKIGHVCALLYQLCRITCDHTHCWCLLFVILQKQQQQQQNTSVVLFIVVVSI